MLSRLLHRHDRPHQSRLEQSQHEQSQIEQPRHAHGRCRLVILRTRPNQFKLAASAILMALFPISILSENSATAQSTTCDGPNVIKHVLTTLDGVSIATYTQGEGTTAIVLVHQVNQDHCGWATEAAALAKNYRVMSIDLRGYGTSQRAKGTTAYAYRNDIAAAVASLRTNGANKVVLVGASMGGSAVVVAGAFITPPVDGIVAVSAPTNYKGQNAKTAAPKLTIPARFIAASDDAAAVTSAQSLNRSATSSPDHQAVVFAKGGHGWVLLRPGSPAEASLIEFLTAR